MLDPALHTGIMAEVKETVLDQLPKLEFVKTRADHLSAGLGLGQLVFVCCAEPEE